MEKNRSQRVQDQRLARTETLDFVCSKGVLDEREAKRRQGFLKTDPRKAFSPKHMVLLAVIFSFFTPVGVFVLLALLFYLPVQAGFSLFAKAFPTNLRMNSDGISLGWIAELSQSSQTIEWSTIRRISIRTAEHAAPKDQLEGITILIDFSLQQYSFYTQISLLFAFWGLRSQSPHQLPWLKIKFPLDALTLDADRMRLLSAVKTYAPEDALTPEFNNLLSETKTPTYTQLWLDDMQSFRRSNTEKLRPGTMLQQDRYQVIDRIGAGGTAVIYKARDTTQDTVVAIKELILPVSAGAEVRNRAFGNVKNECLLLSNLDHPGIVKLQDHFVEDHRAYIVLEYIEGVSLRKMVQDQGAQSETFVIDAALQICSFLQYLHEQTPPVVHRDLAPDNLMIDQTSAIKLLDFNVAQRLESSETKTVVGKHNYMAPEQFKGKPCTGSDIYSLGATLYFLLTSIDPTPLTSSHPGKVVTVSNELDSIISKLTALNLADRYQSIADAAQEIRQLKPS